MAAVLTLGLSPGLSPIAVAQPQMTVAEPAGEAGQTKMRLMTEGQYRNIIANVFGPDIAIDPRFPPVHRMSGLLAVGTTTAGVSSSDAESFHNMAYAVADQVVDDAHRNVLIPCRPADPKAADKACAEKFLSRVGPLLYRRKLTDAELRVSVDEAAQSAKRFGSFYNGLSFALGGMLASPKFLFFVEQSEPDPQHPGQYRLTSYSLATRLSLLLWNATPDAALLEAAEFGKLQDPAVRGQQIQAMIGSPRFEQGVRAFFSDMYAFEDFDTLAKDGSIYPAYSASSTADAAEQMLKFLSYEVIDKDSDYRDLFTSRTTFISPSLAPLYKVAAPSGEWAKYETALDGERRGLLMQIGFLAAHAHPGRSSATRRGRALRELVLCQPVPDPPPNVDFSIIEDPKATFHNARDRLTAHRANPTCAGCHALMDPAGLALEQFDGAGEFRTTENGYPIDTSGQLDGIKFSDARGLSQAVHDDPATTACLVNRVVSYATGRPMTRKDRALLAYFGDRFSHDGYRVKALMRLVAASAAMSQVSPPKADTTSTSVKTASAPRRAQQNEVKS
jgi:Protein of unknown function (DUF1592)/Protein of unknown function (DUF1588)/Protein of unknown function (DUF1585)/Protein of unknown function (DUF1595)